ncbi:uncharacterized protein ACA1_144190 [Acanthamoeba castellanii str. Neff]|uniref:DUF4460 domain-containing protein n=1 Tax=Acanthamoeba castellanii (strain ATCC 30010 / Neff) TaxID=1257118 RepID=L8HH64_ACACF|nr:uncharacterized protein ACA1_144190 [Acanthamoeba castellanii str. Neff]ELR24028.1 hypothetical protein ACA1_144190 [Acanthamoeba castellanii str. Neff]
MHQQRHGDYDSEQQQRSRGQRSKRGPRSGGRKTEEVRSWRRQLLLRVHPDLFQAPQHAHARAVNQRSLQAFQSLVALAGHTPSSTSTTTTSLPAVDDAHPLFTFHFYLRPAHVEADSDDVADVPPRASTTTAEGSSSGGGEEELREVRYAFHPAPEVRRNAVRLRRAAEECMLQLFSLAGLIQPFAASPTPELKTQDGWIRTNWNEDALRQKAIEAIRFAPAEVKMSYQEELAAMLDPDMIFFDKLTHSQKMRAVESLTMNLERLGYADWAHLPLLIGKQYSRRAEGIVVIPYNFTVPRLVEYLNKHLADIKREREHIRADVHLIADLSHRLQERLGLQDVSVWGSKRAAIGCLQRLTDIAGHMASHNLTHATLVLTDLISAPQPQEDEDEREEEQEDGGLKVDGTTTEEELDEPEEQFRYDPSTRRLFVRKDFNKAGLLAYLRRVRPRPDDIVEAPPSSTAPPTLATSSSSAFLKSAQVPTS